MSPQKHPKEQNNLGTYAKYSGVALRMIIIIGLGCYGGMKLDEAYPNHYSLFTLLFSLISVVIAMVVAIRLGRQMEADQNGEDG